MKSVAFFLIMALCGVVEASQVELEEDMTVQELYDHCYDYQFAETIGDFSKAEEVFNIIDGSGYLMTHSACADGRIDATNEIIYQQRKVISGLSALYTQ